MVEDGEQAEEVAKFSLNIEIYERIVEGPQEFIDDMLEALNENGEPLEAEEGEERRRELIKRALAGRNLTPKEEQQEKEQEETEENREESLENDKQQNILQILVIIVVALVLLFATFKMIGGGDDEH